MEGAGCVGRRAELGVLASVWELGALSGVELMRVDLDRGGRDGREGVRFMFPV